MITSLDKLASKMKKYRSLDPAILQGIESLNAKAKEVDCRVSEALRESVKEKPNLKRMERSLKEALEAQTADQDRLDTLEDQIETLRVPPKKTGAKKASLKQVVAKKATPKMPVARQAVAKKAAPKMTAAKQAVVKKTAKKTTVAKQAVAKKAAPKKTAKRG
jgi:hypothetical protein